MPKMTSERRQAALVILEQLARRLSAFTADFFYLALEGADFNEEERVKLVGGCFRTAQKNHWLIRTNISVKSKRNSSNLQSVWLSNIFGLTRDGGLIPKKEIDAENAKWRGRGFEVPEQEARLWTIQREAVSVKRIGARADKD